MSRAGQTSHPGRLEFAPAALALRLTTALRAQGYRDLSRVSTEVMTVAQEMLGVAQDLAAPQALWVRRRVERLTPGALALDDGTVFHGSCFERHLAGAAEAVCFIVTLGPAVDERIAALSAGRDLLEALFLETAGTLAVQKTVREFRAHLAARCDAEGLQPSRRLGPGYGDWPLGDQAALFAMFPGDLPVSLTNGCIMVPLKSLSGMYGLLPVPRAPRAGLAGAADG